MIGDLGKAGWASICSPPDYPRGAIKTRISSVKISGLAHCRNSGRGMRRQERCRIPVSSGSGDVVSIEGIITDHV